jgi:excisionase family DNA binding protein
MKNKITIKEASEVLGVSISTLRRWIAKGVINVTRHPVNNYQLFNKKDLIDLKSKIDA